MPTPAAATVVETADSLFTAIAKGDKATVEHLWSDDIAVWRSGSSRDDEKRRALRVIDWFIGATTSRRYEILDRRVFDDGRIRGLVQQHLLHATGIAGQSISMRVCIVIRVGAGGQIDRIDEYFDPAEIAPLIG